MNKKISIFLFLTIFLADFVYAESTTIIPNLVYPGDIITLTINPSRKDGFYNIIYVHDSGGNVVGLINVNCDIVCKKRTIVNYIVPANFLGEYYFATFDYATDNYELDYFTVMEEGGAAQGELVIDDIHNFGSSLNFLIDPEQGERANIEILANLKDKECDTYQVLVFLCKPELIGSCSSTDYTHQIPLSFLSRKGNICTFNYIGADYFPFYEKAGEWKIIAESGLLSDERLFIYNNLTAISYSSFINFGTLNSQMWNIGVPSSGEDLINFGNVEVMVDWQSSGFSCVSPVGCIDFWSTFYEGENTFQIDDDNLFAEETETGLEPVFITDFASNYFPQLGLSVCISDSCGDDIGEKVTTFYNFKIPGLQKGVYQGDISITLT